MKRIITWLAEYIAFIVGGILVLCFVAMVTNPAWSDERNDIDFDYTGGDTIVNDGDVNVPVNVTGGTQSVTGSNYNSTARALALSNILGDVDIAGCLGSTQWATPLFSKQKLSVNWACLAEVYLRTGKHELAAMAFCNTAIRDEFSSEDECRAAHDFEPVYEAAVVVTESDNDEELELYNDRLLMQELEYDSLQKEVNELRAKKVTVIQQPYLTEKQVKYLRELKE